MNALKHMEAAFVIALSVAGIGSFVASTAQDAQAREAVQANAPQMAVVTVVGKRLTPAEKAASLRAETAATTLVASR
jgi:hypothetical protein